LSCVLLLVLFDSAAHADDEDWGRPAWAPHLVWALEDLSFEHRCLLARASALSPDEVLQCRYDPESCRLARREPCLQTNDKSERRVDWHRELGTIVARLAGLGGWKAAVPPRVLAQGLVLSSDQGSLLELAGRFALFLGGVQDKTTLANYKDGDKIRAVCAGTYKEVLRYAQPPGRFDPLFGDSSSCLNLVVDSYGDDLKRALKDRYPPYALKIKVDAILSEMRRLLGQTDFLAVRAKDNDSLQVVALAPGGEAEFFQAAAFVKIREKSDLVASQVFIVPVPHRSLVTTRLYEEAAPSDTAPPVATAPAVPLPEVRTYSIDSLHGGTEPYSWYRGNTRCVGWDVRLPDEDKSVVVFFDGEPVAPVTTRSVALSEMIGDPPTHQLVVVRKSTTSNDAVVLADVQISSVELDQSGCKILPLDLRNDVTRDTKVGLLSATADPSCISAGIDSDMLRHRVQRFLRDGGMDAPDTKGLAEAVTGYAELAASLSRLGGDSAGASQGRLSTRAELGFGVAQALRNRFRWLLSLAVTCAPSGPTFSFAVRSTVVDLKDFLRPGDNVTGRDIEEFARTQVEVFAGPGGLQAAAVAVLARSLGQPYVRTQQGFNHEALYARAHESVRVFLPKREEAPAGGATSSAGDDYALRLEVRRFVEDEESFHVCSVIDGASMLRDDTPLGDLWDQLQEKRIDHVVRSIHPDLGAEAAYDIDWEPYTAGNYLVRVRLERRGEPLLGASTTGYRCVEAFDSTVRLEGTASYSINVGPGIHSDARAEQFGYTRVMASVSHATSAYSHVLIGVAVGYADAIHTRGAPPAWQLVGTSGGTGPTYDASGGLTLTWTRQSFLIGPQITYYAPALLCAIKSLPCQSLQRNFGLIARVIPALDVGVIDASSIPSQLPDFASSARGANFELSAFVQGGISARLEQQKEIHLMLDAGFLGISDLFRGPDQRSSLETISYDANFVLGVAVGGELGL
jgi:hypothetical protein